MAVFSIFWELASHERIVISWPRSN